MTLRAGINYVGSPLELSGACNDVERMREYIVKQGFSDASHSMRVLRDDGQPGNILPTKNNIVAALKWLVEGAEAGDSLFLHYSGHGARIRDTSGDESDGYDEVMLPCDYAQEDPDGGEHRILCDDDIYKMVVAPLKKGVSLVSVMDCCHSGTLMDLPYTCTLTREQFATLEDDFRMNVPIGSVDLVKDMAVAITSGVVGLMTVPVEAIDRSFDWVEQSLKRMAKAIEERMGVGGKVKGRYLALQKAVRDRTSFRLRLGLRQPRNGSDPTDMEERRADLVHRFVY